MHRLRIATLNLWNLKDWWNRFHLIIEELESQNADIVFLQEVQAGGTADQIKELAEATSYLYSEHTPFTRKKDYFEHGLGILSRFHFSSTSHKHAYVRTEQRGFVETTFRIDSVELRFVNVHFDNTDEGSIIHLKEVLEYLAHKRDETIIIGDFNCFDPKAVSELTSDTHRSSFDIRPYTSYSDEGTLDYILVPKSINITSLECVERRLSDHKMVIADIEF